MKLNLIWMCTALIGTSTWAMADDLGSAPPPDETELTIDKTKKTRSSKVSLSLTGDGEDYTSNTLGVRLGLDESWQLQFSGTTSRSEGAVGYRSLSIKADDIVSDFFSFSFGIKGQNEPNSLRAGGGNLGLDFTISELWQGDLSTRIGLSSEGLVYQIPILGKFGQNRAISTLQSCFTFSITQDITQTIDLELSASFYRYGTSSQSLSRFVNNRVTKLPNVMGVISGFPDSYFSISANWEFLKNWSVGASGTNSTGSESDVVTRGLGLNLDWKSEKHWGIGVEALSSKSDDSTIPSSTFGLNLAYRW
ncbi:MAG: hypothetical protein JNL01_09145 [Bdellovibrionales bacterium]|nr:hypothetical protein [Bdellovibrionales bacterium]